MIRILVYVVLMSSGFTAGADLFYPQCAVQNSQGESVMVVQSGSRLSCEDLRRVAEGAELIQLALYPATVALMSSPVKAQLWATLAELGLTMANPAVLGITVLGASGVVVFYMVMKVTMAECERMDRIKLKNEILREVEKTYGISARDVELQF